MADKIYLDDNGNPIIAPKVYLDDNGNPIKGVPKPALQPPVETKTEAQLRGFIEGAKQGASDLAEGTKEGLTGAVQPILHPYNTVKGLVSSLASGAEALPDIARNIIASPQTALATAKGFSQGAGSAAAGITDPNASFSRKVGQFVGGVAIPAVVGAGVVKGFRAPSLAAVPGEVAEGISPTATAAVKQALAARTVKAATSAATSAANQAELRVIANGLAGGDVPDAIVAKGLPDSQPNSIPKPRLVTGHARTTPTAIATDALTELQSPAPEPGVELPPAPYSNGARMPPEQPRISIVAGGKRGPTGPVVPFTPSTDGPLVAVTDAPSLGPDARTTPAVERRVTPGVAPGGVERRALDPNAPIDTTNVVEAALRMMQENPQILKQAKALGERSRATRMEAPPRQSSIAPAPDVTPDGLPDVVAPQAPGIRVQTPTGLVTVRPKPGVASDLRAVMGARRAAQFLGISPDDVRQLAPGPSRIPMVAQLAELDNDYARRIADERGSIDPKTALKIGLPVAGGLAGAAAANDGHKLAGGVIGALGGLALANPTATARAYQQARMLSFLSGAALPKHVLSTVGAATTAALEQGSTAPLRELLSGQTVRDTVRAFKSNGNPMGLPGLEGGLAKLNLPGRAMNAMATGATNALQRAGLSEDEAERLQLLGRNAVGGNLQQALQSPAGRYLVPFQRIPYNQGSEGLKQLSNIMSTPPPDKMPFAMPHTTPTAVLNRQRALTAAAIAGGAGAATQTKDPVTLTLMAALLGTRGLPFAAGALGSLGANKGMSLADRMGEMPTVGLKDVVSPTSFLEKPAIVNWVKYLQGNQ